VNHPTNSNVADANKMESKRETTGSSAVPLDQPVLNRMIVLEREMKEEMWIREWERKNRTQIARTGQA